MFQPFLIAAESDLSAEFNYLRQLPKAELHLHLGGAYPLNYLLSIATPQQGEELKMALDLIAKRVAYRDVFRFFQIVSQIIDTEEKVQKGTESLCHALQEDRVTYAEIRTGLKNLGHGYEAYLNAVLNGIRQGTSPAFQANLLLSFQRNSSPEVAKTTVDLALKYRSFGIIGIDISGDSCVGQIERIMPDLLRAKEEGLSIVLHIGESQNEINQLYLLESLHPNRIGHGVHLSEDAKEWIKQHRIPLEVCLTSSVLVEMIDQPNAHPGIHYFQQGYPIVLCTDDPLLFSTTLSQEFLIAHKLGFSLEELTKIAQNSFQHALNCPPKEDPRQDSGNEIKLAPN